MGGGLGENSLFPGSITSACWLRVCLIRSHMLKVDLQPPFRKLLNFTFRCLPGAYQAGEGNERLMHPHQMCSCLRWCGVSDL